MEENMAKRIRAAMERAGVSYGELAGMTGIPKSALQRYATGETANIPIDRVEKIAAATRVPAESLLGWMNEKTRRLPAAVTAQLLQVRRRKVPLLGEIACGKPIFAAEDRDSYVSLGTDLDVDFCLKAKGDSMVGARIMDGDVVFIKAMDMVDNGQIAAVVIGDEATLKRVYYYPEQAKIILSAENPRYAPLSYAGDELEQVHILGLAVAFQSDVR